jgi:iron(III) transport system ATP-binding protein
MTDAQLLYRAQDIGIGAVAGRPSLDATFSEAAPIAGQTMVTAMVGDMRVTGMAEGYFSARPGDPIVLALLRDPDAVFTTDGERVGR